MYAYTSDLHHELATKVRMFDRANDFTKRDEYERILNAMEEQDTELEEELEQRYTEIDQLRGEYTELQENRDSLVRSLDSIKALAEEAIARDPVTEMECELLDALAAILMHCD